MVKLLNWVKNNMAYPIYKTFDSYYGKLKCKLVFIEDFTKESNILVDLYLSIFGKTRYCYTLEEYDDETYNKVKKLFPNFLKAKKVGWYYPTEEDNSNCPICNDKLFEKFEKLIRI